MNDINKQRIYWHSRRGMLELDLLLMPFARDVFDTLDAQDQLSYRDLLAQEDQDLWNWLLDRGEPPEPRFRPIIARILAHQKGSA